MLSYNACSKIGVCMKTKKYFFFILSIFLLTFSIFAQSKVSVTIIASEGPAQIILDGKLYGTANPQMTISLAKGSYDLTVRKAGVGEYKQRITVGSRAMTVHAPLGSGTSIQQPNYPVQPVQPSLYNLHVTSNVFGADVFVNTVPAGKTPFTGSYPPGTYTITVKSPSYPDYMQTITLNRDMTINANLGPSLVPFSLGNLIPGAEIYLNGSRLGVTGNNGRFQTQVQPGNYTLVIRTPGYIEFSLQINVGNNGYNYNPTLQARNASFRIQIPGLQLESSYRRNSPWNQVSLFVDNKEIKNYYGQSLDLSPGQHSITVISGVFQAHLSQNFSAGKEYTLEPFTGMNVR